MPNMDGLTLTARIRQDVKNKELPVVLVTSLADAADRKRGIEAGANAYIPKQTFNQQLLVETVVLALAGGLLGSIVGVVGSMWIAWQANWRVVISPLSVLLAWGLAGLVGLVFGLYPAYRASRLDPIGALRCE